MSRILIARAATIAGSHPLQRPLVALFWTLPLVALVASGHPGAMGTASLVLAWCVACGDLVSSDRRSSLLPVIFARPVARCHYVLCTWLGASLGCFALAATHVVAAELHVVLVLHERGLSPAHLAVSLVRCAAGAIGFAALYVLLGALSGRSPAFALHVACVLSLALVGHVDADTWPLTCRALDEWKRLMAPALDGEALTGGVRLSWFELTSWASSVAAFLSLAILAVERTDLTYSDAG